MARGTATRRVGRTSATAIPTIQARHSWYRSADRNYRNEYGSRERYRDEYRQGFQEGYDRAFREYGYRR